MLTCVVEGNEPHILKLLDSMYLQNYPTDILEFGPAIVPLQRRQPVKKSLARVDGGPWKPEGTTYVEEFDGDLHQTAERVVVDKVFKSDRVFDSLPG